MILSERTIPICHRKNFQFSICIFLSVIGFSALAQSFYSVDPNYLKRRTENSNFNSDYTNAYPDTGIIKNHQFINRNFMGNIGLSNPNYLLKFNSSSLGFKLFPVPLEDTRIKKEDVEYFKTKGPFAELTGISGSKQLQMFRMLFSNSFKNKLNVSMRLNRYTSQGFYTGQQSFTNNFFTSSNYETKNKRFGFNAYILVNNNKFQENGGVINDTMRQRDLLVTKTLIPVKLTGASRENRELSFMYTNWYRLNKNEKGLNSFLQFKSSYSSIKYKYKDNEAARLSTYYSIFNLDTTKTLDSTRLRTYNNELNLSLQTKNKNLVFNVGYENELSQIWQHRDTSFMNHIVKANISLFKSFISADSLSHTDLINSGSANYIAAGAFAGNYKFETLHSLNFFRNNKLKEGIHLKLLAEERTPDYIFKRWYSNHFYWENKFNNTQTVQAELAFKIPMLQVSAIYKGVTNYLYFDKLGFAAQNSGMITNTAVKINFENIFFKHIGIRLNQTFQNSSSTVISLPNSVSLASLFYKGNLFKNNLQLCVGAQVEYYNQFVPYGYTPATQTFHIQDKYTAGNYPFVDVFFNARIKPVSIFIKMENVLQGILGTNYSMVPGYYQPEMAMRFGFTWLFFD